MNISKPPNRSKIAVSLEHGRALRFLVPNCILISSTLDTLKSNVAAERSSEPSTLTINHELLSTAPNRSGTAGAFEC